MNSKESPSYQADRSPTIRSLDMMKILVFIFIIGTAVSSDFPDVTTIYRLDKHDKNETGANVTQWKAQVYSHARAESMGYPFQLTNGSVIGPNLETDFSDCVALQDGCDWLRTSDWVLKKVPENVLKDSLSIGDSPMMFSLEGVGGTITSANYNTTAGGGICIDIYYYIEGQTSIDVVVKVGGTEYPLSMTKSSFNNLWKRDRFTRSLPEEVNGDTRIEIKAKKNAAYKLYVQWITSCSIQQRPEDVLVLEATEYSLPIVGQGFTIARQLTDKTATSVECRNGGFWDDKYKACNCPAGFNGTLCEEGCGPNRYGEDCGGMCSHTQRACRGMYLCRPDRDCDCAPGLRGKFCVEECSPGSYGTGCKQSCGHCAAGTCNIYTGTCHQGCKPGYTLPLCQFNYNYLRNTPNVSITKSDDKTIDVKANFQELEGDSTHKPSFYQLQYRIVDDAGDAPVKDDATLHWEKQEIQGILSDSDSEEILVGRLSSLEPGRIYEIRVVLIDADSGTYQGSRVPVYHHQTSCEVPDSLEYNIEVYPLEKDGIRVKWKYSADEKAKKIQCSVVRYEIHVKLCWQWVVHSIDPLRHVAQEYDVIDLLQGELYEVKMRAVTIRGPANFSPTKSATVRDQAPLSHVTNLTVRLFGEDCRVEWSRPRHATTDIDHYKITFECIRLLACSEKVEPSTCGAKTPAKTTSLSTQIDGLLPYAQYNISVYVVDTSNREGEPLSIIVTTNADKPNVTLSSGDREPIADESSVTVYWEAPGDQTCQNHNGEIIGYSCQIKDKKFSWKHVAPEKSTPLPQVTFDKLEPTTEYIVTVYLITTAGKSVKPLTINVQTTAEPPKPVRDLEVYKRTSTTLGVRWRDPPDSDKLKSFSVGYKPTGQSSGGIFTMEHYEKCSAWPEKHCFVITNLAKDTLYDITVSARRDGTQKDGKPEFLKNEITREGNPGPPSNLEKISINDTSVTLEWNIPEQLNGTLRSFRVYAHFVPDETKDVVKSLDVEAEKETYSYTMTGLLPGSEYTVDVYALNTEHFGPKISTTIRTSSL